MPEFGDIELSYKVDGVSQEGDFPNKNSEYKSESVTCNDGVTAEWDNASWGLINIKSKDNRRIKCTINFVKDTSLATKAQIGDYVTMEPISTNFEIPSSLTGYVTEKQTINPSELTTWRIINIKEDETIEMISENISTDEVFFQGSTGYKNIVGTLNLIVKQYENNKYTINSRSIGYNGQTAFINDLLSRIKENKPWDSAIATTDNSRELEGGGDILYQTDIDLVNKAVGTLEATKVGVSANSQYWLASRYYENFYFGGNAILNGGVTHAGRLYTASYEDVTGDYYKWTASVRPIVVLKSNIQTSGGTGAKESPWTLS